MGIMKAALEMVSGGLADQWLEVIEADDMGEQTVFTHGVKIRKGQNVKGTVHTVSDGSVIHVYENQFMMLVDGGKVVDYTAEPGYYKVDNSALPSLFNGRFGDALTEALNRVKYGGETPSAQKVYFINLQEIKGIKFGTRNPINYFDNFYNAELRLRVHGTYSIKIVNPLKFYAEAIPRNAEHVDITDINEQYLDEFMGALSSTINQLSAEGQRISYITSQTAKISKYMADALDADWTQLRGMEIVSVGMNAPSYDEESKKMIDMRNQGAMLSDAAIREGYLQGSIARGIEAAGSNANGSMAGFMGVGMGMQAGSFGTASQTNLQQMQMQRAQQMTQPKAAVNGWVCGCGAVNSGKFCSECGKPAPSAEWICECGTVNSGKFCSECGKPRA
ncbi:MAG: SPFH domain-containing protein [Lachnospiraceae bacterium]